MDENEEDLSLVSVGNLLENLLSNVDRNDGDFEV